MSGRDAMGSSGGIGSVKEPKILRQLKHSTELVDSTWVNVHMGDVIFFSSHPGPSIVLARVATPTPTSPYLRQVMCLNDGKIFLKLPWSYERFEQVK